MYKYPRIKKIYPLYKMTKNTFRIGAQRGITKEFYDPSNELWTLANLLDGRSLKDVLEEERKAFPNSNMSDEYIIDEIDLLNKEGFIEEKLPEENLSPRYLPNIRYFSKYIDAKGNRYLPQKNYMNLPLYFLDWVVVALR